MVSGMRLTSSPRYIMMVKRVGQFGCSMKQQSTNPPNITLENKIEIYEKSALFDWSGRVNME